MLTPLHRSAPDEDSRSLEHACWSGDRHAEPGSASAPTTDGRAGHATSAAAAAQQHTLLPQGLPFSGLCLGPAPQTTGSRAADAQPPPHSPSPPQQSHHMPHFATAAASWQASGATLASLHALASALAPPGGAELTPVQVFVELAGRFPLAVLLRRDVHGALRRGLVAVVLCRHYGAAVARRDFEAVVAGVLGEGEG